MVKLLSLFSGIGAFEKALQNLDIPFELVAYCEIDKYARNFNLSAKFQTNTGAFCTVTEKSRKSVSASSLRRRKPILACSKSAFAGANLKKLQTVPNIASSSMKA